jgi:hypothetical protein
VGAPTLDQEEPVTPDETEPRERADLVSRYRDLVLRELPRRGAAEHWVVRADHCFGRIVLDHAVGRCWYEVLDRHRSPAFEQLDDERLRVAVELAERIEAEGDPLLRQLNDQSLRWRGHPPEGSTRSRQRT